MESTCFSAWATLPDLLDFVRLSLFPDPAMFPGMPLLGLAGGVRVLFAVFALFVLAPEEWIDLAVTQLSPPGV